MNKIIGFILITIVLLFLVIGTILDIYRTIKQETANKKSNLAIFNALASNSDIQEIYELFKSILYGISMGKYETAYDVFDIYKSRCQDALYNYITERYPLLKDYVTAKAIKDVTEFFMIELDLSIEKTKELFNESVESDIDNE